MARKKSDRLLSIYSLTWVFGSLILLLAQLLRFLAIPFNDALVLLYLLLISLILGLLLTLHVISDERAGAQAQRSPDRCAGSRVTYGRSNNATRGGTPQRADARSLLPRGQGSAWAAGKEKHS
jgi:hypothetical protein